MAEPEGPGIPRMAARNVISRPTMLDVAIAAGVSKALVSIAFRDAPGVSAQTRARILEIGDRIGYRPNRTASLLASRRTKLLGLTMNVRNAFHGELVEDIQAVADSIGYEIVLSTLTRTHDERRAIGTLLEFRCEALILLGPDLPVADLERLGAQLPVVSMGRHLPAIGLDVVRSADDVGLHQVVDHLVEQGHRRIVHVDGGPGPIADDRRAGYRSAMIRHGLGSGIDEVGGGHSEFDGMRAADELLRRPELPTAIAAYNDRCAVGLLDRLSRAGVAVPQQVSITGYDDSVLAGLALIDLTTVNQQAFEQAEWAVTTAVQRLDGEPVDRQESIMTPRLVPRGTTSHPRP